MFDIVSEAELTN